MADQVDLKLVPNSGISVPFKQLHEQTTEGGDRNGVTASVTYIVDWADRWQFYREMMGKTVSYGLGQGMQYTRYVPASYPDNTRLLASSFRMTPVGKSHPNGLHGRYDYAVVVVDFSTPEYPTSGDDNFRTEKLSFSADILQLPEGAYVFPDGTPVPQTLGIVMPTIELSITTHRFPTFPLPYVLATIGTVNQSEWYGAAPGTMLFIGCETSRQSTVLGSPQWQIDWKFQYRQVEWNKLKHPILPTFEYVFQKPNPQIGNDPSPIYQYSDFNGLPV